MSTTVETNNTKDEEKKEAVVEKITPEEANEVKTDGVEKSKRKKTGGKRGGIKRRMATLAYQRMMQRRANALRVRPMFPMVSNSIRFPPNVPLAPLVRPFPMRKFGFFNEAAPSVHPGHPGSEKRTYDGPMKARVMIEEMPSGSGPPVPKPLHAFSTREQSNILRSIAPPFSDLATLHQESGSKAGAGMNELFAKMVWKKLDMIQCPTRLSRLHTEIMNILQQAIAEEATAPN